MFIKYEVFVIPQNLKAEDIINWFANEFNNSSKVIINNEIVSTSKTFSLVYNSFTPDLELEIKNKKLYVTYKLAPIIRLFMLTLSIILFAFFLVFIVLALNNEIKWIFCLIPIGIIAFMCILSVVGFLFEVRKISLCIASKIK